MSTNDILHLITLAFLLIAAIAMGLTCVFLNDAQRVRNGKRTIMPRWVYRERRKR